MSKNQLNTLIIDTGPQNHTTTKQMLARVTAWQIHSDWEVTYEAALSKIDESPYDVCLLNYHDNNELTFLRKAIKNGRTTPFIMVLASDNKKLAAAALDAGAIDCLVSSQTDSALLERSFRFAIKYKQLVETLYTRIKTQTFQLAKKNTKLQEELNRFRNAAQTLREREQHYRMFFNLDVYGIEELDTKGNIVDCNTTFESLLGYTRSEIIGLPSARFLSETSKKMVEAKLTNIQEQGYTESEIELVKKDGTFLTLWRRYRAIYDSNGTWTGIVSFNRDITERMKAVKQISSLARALEQSPVAIMITDDAGNIDYVNFKFTELTEYDYDDIVEKNLHTLLSESLSSQAYEAMWQAVSAGKEWQNNLHNHKKGGQEYWESVIVTPMFDSKGKITHYIVVIEDISDKKRTEDETLQSQRRVGDLMSEHISDLTEANQILEHEIADRKRAESTLRRSRARLKAQYKGIPMPTYSWQKAGDNFILVDYNDAAERDSQGKIADFMGKPVSEVFNGKKTIIADFDRCYNKKKMIKREAPYQSVTTGEQKHFVTTYNFVPPNLVMVHIEDITNYKQIETQLRKHEAQLEELTKQQAEALAKTKVDLAHEHIEHEYAEALLYNTEERLKHVSDALKYEAIEHEHSEEVLHKVEDRIKEISSNIDDRLREQYRTIPIPAYTWQVIGGEFILIDFNDAAAEAMGRIIDFLGKSASEVFKNRSQVLDDFNKSYKEQTKVKREAPYQMVTTGEQKFFKTTYDFIPPNLVIVHIEDITKHKLMENQLVEYRSKFETITTKHKAELTKRNEAARREIHKRKQLEHALYQAKTQINKHPTDHMTTELNVTQQAELIRTLDTERAKHQKTEQTLKMMQTQIDRHQQEIEHVVAECTTDLDKENKQLKQELVVQQRADDALREIRKRLKAQYKNIPVPTYSWQILDDDFVLVDYNRAARKSSRGMIAELMGKTARQVFKKRPQVIADFKRCLQEKQTIKRSAPYKLLSTGQTKQFVTTYSFVPTNLIIVYIQDVTDHKQTERALHDSEAQVEILCRYSPLLKLTFVSNVYCWYYNKHRADLMGQKLLFVHDDDRETVEKQLKSLTLTNPVVVLEYKTVKPSGIIRKQQWINRGTFDQQGQLIEIESVGRDITDQTE